VTSAHGIVPAPDHPAFSAATDCIGKSVSAIANA